MQEKNNTRRSVTLSPEGQNATENIFQLIENSLPPRVTEMGIGNTDGQAQTQKIKVFFPNNTEIDQIAEGFRDELTLEFPQAEKVLRDFLLKKIYVVKDGKLIRIKVIDAIVDPNVEIPEADDGSRATTKQQLIGMLGMTIIPKAISHVETLKRHAIKKSPPDDPIRKLGSRPFGSRGGWLAKGVIDVMSSLSAIPNYFWFSYEIEKHFPNYAPEIKTAVSIYLATALAKGVNKYDRRSIAAAMQDGQGYIAGTLKSLKSEDKLGDKAVEFLPVKIALNTTETVIKRVKSWVHELRLKTSDRNIEPPNLDWTLNPDITKGQYTLKALALVLASYWTTCSGYIATISTQNSFEQSLSAAGQKVANQRDQELRKWVESLVRNTELGNEATVGNLVAAITEVENSGVSKKIGDNVIRNQTTGGKGYAYKWKEAEAPKVLERIEQRALAEIQAERVKIISMFENLALPGAALDEKTAEGLLNRYMGLITSRSSEKVREKIEEIAQEELRDFGSGANHVERESRSMYGIARADAVAPYNLTTAKPEFKQLEKIDITLTREELDVVMERIRREKGILGIMEVVALGVLITFLLEKAHLLLLPNIAGNLAHYVRNKLRRERDKTPYMPSLVPYSHGQQITLLWKPYGGLKLEGDLTSNEDQRGTIQRLLDAQRDTIANIYSDALASLNTEFGLLIPGFEGFTPDNIARTLRENIENDVNGPSLITRALEPIMADGAVYRRRRRRAQKKHLARQQNAIQSGIGYLISTGRATAFKDFVNSLLPIRTCMEVFRYAEAGKILDVGKGMKLAMLAWQKSGKSDKAALKAIKEVSKDPRAIDTLIAYYEHLPTPEEPTAYPFYTPPQQGDQGISGDFEIGDPGISGDPEFGDPGISGDFEIGDPGISGDFEIGDPRVEGTTIPTELRPQKSTRARILPNINLDPTSKNEESQPGNPTGAVNTTREIKLPENNSTKAIEIDAYKKELVDIRNDFDVIFKSVEDGEVTTKSHEAYNRLMTRFSDETDPSVRDRYYALLAQSVNSTIDECREEYETLLWSYYDLENNESDDGITGSNNSRSTERETIQPNPKPEVRKHINAVITSSANNARQEVVSTKKPNHNRTATHEIDTHKKELVDIRNDFDVIFKSVEDGEVTTKSHEAYNRLMTRFSDETDPSVRDRYYALLAQSVNSTIDECREKYETLLWSYYDLENNRPNNVKTEHENYFRKIDGDLETLEFATRDNNFDLLAQRAHARILSYMNHETYPGLWGEYLESVATNSGVDISTAKNKVNKTLKSYRDGVIVGQTFNYTPQDELDRRSKFIQINEDFNTLADAVKSGGISIESQTALSRIILALKQEAVMDSYFKFMAEELDETPEEAHREAHRNVLSEYRQMSVIANARKFNHKVEHNG